MKHTYTNGTATPTDQMEREEYSDQKQIFTAKMDATKENATKKTTKQTKQPATILITAKITTHKETPTDAHKHKTKQH